MLRILIFPFSQLMKHGTLILIVYLFLSSNSFGQLKPGFEPNEYKQILGVFAHHISDTTFSKGIPKPKTLKMDSESPTVGLETKWNLWLNESKKIAVFSIRGTIPNQLLGWQTFTRP